MVGTMTKVYNMSERPLPSKTSTGCHDRVHSSVETVDGSVRLYRVEKYSLKNDGVSEHSFNV